MKLNNRAQTNSGSMLVSLYPHKDMSTFASWSKIKILNKMANLVISHRIKEINKDGENDIDDEKIYTHFSNNKTNYPVHGQIERVPHQI